MTENPSNLTLNENEKALLHAIASIDDSIKFCSFGQLEPVLPGLKIDDIGSLSFPVSVVQAKQLIKLAEQAPYGKGANTIVDTKVRRVWQIDSSRFKFLNPDWDQLIAKTLKQIQEDFALTGTITAQIYKLLIYEKGGFFAPHKDTEKESGMFGTLVVTLPSAHKGGALIVTHEDKRIEIPTDGSDYAISYSAFYADCLHEVMPVTEGYRISLVYNMISSSNHRKISAPSVTNNVQTMANLIEDIFATTSREKIAIPLSHDYTQVSLSPQSLKGKDLLLFEILDNVSRLHHYDLYLALFTYHQSSSAEYDYYYGEFDDNDDVEIGEIIDEDLALSNWIDVAGNKLEINEVSIKLEDILFDGDYERFKMEQEVEGPTGNAGATVERWYRQGMVVLWPIKNRGKCIGKMDATYAITLLEQVAKDSSRREEALQLADAITESWQTASRWNRHEDITTTTMLKALTTLADLTSAKRFIEGRLIQNLTGKEGEQLSILCNKIGWQNLADSLKRLFNLESHNVERSWERVALSSITSVFVDLCCTKVSEDRERIIVIKSLVSVVLDTVLRWDCDANRKGGRYDNHDLRAQVVEDIFVSFIALDESQKLRFLLDKVITDATNYPLHKTLIPAVRNLKSHIKKSDVLSELIDFCIKQLQTLTQTEPKFPDDWSRQILPKCSCKECENLISYIKDEKREMLRVCAAQHIRSHLENVIKGSCCDLDLKTDTKGRPYTLVCTKNQNSYEKLHSKYLSDLKLLTEMEKLRNPPF